MFGHISRLNDKIAYFPLKKKKTFELSKKSYVFRVSSSNENELYVSAKDGLDTELNIYVNSIIQEFSKIQDEYKFQEEKLKLHLRQFKFNIFNIKLLSFGFKKESYHNLGYDPICFEKIKVTLLGITIFENKGNNTIALKLIPNEIYYHSINNIEKQYYVTPNDFDIKKISYDKYFTYLDIEKHSPAFLVDCKLLSTYNNGKSQVFKFDCESSFIKIIDEINQKFKLENYQTKFLNTRMFNNDPTKIKCYINGKKETINSDFLNKYEQLGDICNFKVLIKPYIFKKNGKNLNVFNLQKIFIDIGVNKNLLVPLKTSNNNYFFKYDNEFSIFDKHMLHNETLKAYGFPKWDKYYYQKVKQFQKLFILFPYYENNGIVKTLEKLKGLYKNAGDDKVIVKIGEKKVIKIFLNDVHSLMENNKFINKKKFKTEDDAKNMLIRYFSKNNKFNIYYKFNIKNIFNPKTKEARKVFFVVANFNKITEVSDKPTKIKIEDKLKNIALEI